MKPAETTASDMPQGGWVDRMPETLRPYLRLARLDRPIGTWLLLFPCWWGLVLASPGLGAPRHLILLAVLFAAGALVMRGAGCTFNDIIDRDIDAKVARTAQRPIPSGAVSPRQAALFLGLQLATGLAVLLSFNLFTIALGVSSLLLVAAYPFMKRITYWPQAWLGLTFNWGALLGFAAVAGELQSSALLLYAAGFFWTLGYDTIYAHQDKADDLIAGVKSLALKLGDDTRPWLIGFYSVAAALMAAAGAAAGLGWPFYVLLVLAFAQLLWQALTAALDDPNDCLAKFRANRLFGWLVLAALIAGQAWRTAAGP
jgi:4-hydroxybenzoate polyprenyltransferase